MFQVDPMGSEIVSTITASAMAVSIVQWLKNTKLVPFMDQHTAGINRIVGWVFATISAFGLHYTYDSATGTLTLTGLTVAALSHSIWDVVKSYAFQKLIYAGVIKGPAQVAEAQKAVGAAPGQQPVVPVAAGGTEEGKP